MLYFLYIHRKSWKGLTAFMKDHLKKQNACFYISALLSVAIMALMFLPWLVQPKSASLLTIVLDSVSPVVELDLLLFLIPLMLGVLVMHIVYLISIFRPGEDPVYSPTVSLLLVGVTLIVFLLATDITYDLISVTDKVYTNDFLVFLGVFEGVKGPDGYEIKGDPNWTLMPVIWLVLAVAQAVIAKFAHKKEVISYT